MTRVISGYLIIQQIAANTSVDKLCVRQGDIYQRVDATAGVIDNIVTLKFPKPFFLPNAQQPAAQACLRHSYSVVDGNEVKIVYESTSAEPLLDRCASAVSCFAPKVL